MLNISSNDNHVPEHLRAFEQEAVDVMPRANRLLRFWLSALLLIFFVFMFLPWTQNIQSNGKLTTLLPEDRPQTIQSTIAGRIEDWYVREGQMVAKGDTIVRLSEVKEDYLDPLLVDRTSAQRDAKLGSAASYQQKIAALDAQIQAIREQLVQKENQLDQKLAQNELKTITQRAEIENAEAQAEIARIQAVRSDTLFRRGIDSRGKFEEKSNKLAAATAKLVSARNKLSELQNERTILQSERRNLLNDAREKIAKAQSDRATAMSNYYAASGEVEKLSGQVASYSARREFYYVTAPQDALISQAYVSGVGEMVKEGGTLVSIVPASQRLAVELFVRPMDLPLLQLGQEVRLIFDGWPAVVFGGWPGLSFGTFFGEVASIDNNTNVRGEYRILVAPSDPDAWPEQLRPGSGARGIALLSNVPLWYELWRQLNGFPADYYLDDEGDGKEKSTKAKAPLKKVIK